MSTESISQLLPKLSTQELSDLKHSIDQEILSRLRTLGVNGELTEEEATCVRNRDLIRCVKLIRDRTGLGLADAKRYMDRAREQLVQHSEAAKREAAQIEAAATGRPIDSTLIAATSIK